MAGQIRKGFFFYFGLFVLLLVAIFLVCVVIMIFNPGKTVLWMQYFSHNTTYHISKTTDESQIDIDWSKVTDLEINCTYADVVIERNDNPKFPEDELYIYNNSKGFTTAANAVQFDYTVEFEANDENNIKLLVNVAEPEGFLFFSKNITIVLHATSIDGNPTNFNNLNLTVNTEQGNVSLGGGYNDTRSSAVTLKSADIKTGKGNIAFNNHFETRALTSLKLETASGNMGSSYVTSLKNSNSESLTGLELACEASLTTSNGRIGFEGINSTQKLEITCKKGTVVLDNVHAASLDVVASIQGSYVFGEVFADVNFNSHDSMMSPNIIIDKVHGNFVIGTSAENGSAPDIEIGQIDGAMHVYSSKGKLNVENVLGDIEIISNDNLSVNVGVDKTNRNKIVVYAKSGDVNLDFLGAISRNVQIVTEQANVTIDVTGAAKFEASFFKYNPELSEIEENEILPVSNITIGLGEVTLNETNPRLTIGSGDDLGEFKIYTNAHVNFNLVAAA